MTKQKKQLTLSRCISLFFAVFYGVGGIPGASGYAFNEIVPDVRQPSSVSGGSACPVASHDVISQGSISEQWSTVLGTNPVTILTQNQTPAGRINEIEQVITQSLAVWTGVSGTILVPGTFSPVTRTATQKACGSDGVNSICLDQADGAFTPGILAFTRVITADIIGVQVGTGSPSRQAGQILDADIYFNPGGSMVTFATPAALATSPTAYDFESLMIHELGHTLGFSHSASFSWKSDVARSAENLRRLATTAVPKRLGGVRQTTLRWPRIRAAVPGPLHPSRGHLQPSPGLVYGREGLLPLARLRS